MTIYEIDNQIYDLIDSETGEVLDFSAFEQLQMEREQKIENICLYIKNLTAEAKDIREEEKILAERRTAKEKRVESLKKLLDYALQGAKFETPKVEVKYRKSNKVQIDDSFIDWAKENADDLLTYAEPKPSLKAIGDAIKNGRTVQGAEIIENNNIQIK